MTDHVEAVRGQESRGAGPKWTLPDRRAHELFEDRARDTPSAVAAVHRGTRWTYARLDAAADRVAGALLAAGLQPEGVVAVISHRSLDWLASILGVFKAGGVYLPIDPAYPDERIAELVRRSGCRVALVEDGLSAVRIGTAVDVLAMPPETAAGARPGRVPARGLACAYFTFESADAPKGAACEHEGVLNHLLAKVDVFGLEPGAVVAQTTSHCSSDSLWQALAPLVAGGTAVIIDPEVMLDVPALLRLLAEENVGVLQLTPSHLDVIVTRLESGHRAAGSLRMIGVTGAVVGHGLLARWFDQCPEVPVVNAYGAVEASGDTTHEVIRAVVDGEPVAVGLPIANVFVDVLGPDGLPVAGDAIGEITFSGVCVGRGYLDDPDGTPAAFGTDPLRPGLRRYRTGDRGHWLPGGRLRFVGRRDEQATIGGVRIEVGEVESALRQVPGVRSACVIVLPDGPGERLAGFYAGQAPIPQIRDLLAERVPSHQLPAVLRWLPELPCTDEGEVDRRELADLEISSANGNSLMPPRTGTERRIATVWAEVLGLPLDEIGRNDNFFAHGGGSLEGLLLVVRLRGLVSLVDLMANPSLADLAAAVDGASTRDSSLLQPLSVPEGASVALVCVPYEAGNALNFEAMARELSTSDVAVYAVELPGHDAARPDDELASLDRLAGRLSQEILDHVDLPVALWGHGTGVALALETCRSLQAAGVVPRHLFLAAADPRESSGREAADIGAWLRDTGAFTDVDQWRSARGELIERAYRHDLREAEGYLASCTTTLDLPATIITIPRAPGESDAAARCAAILPEARITRFENAGRYVVRSHPAVTAELVTATVAGKGGIR
ncbi:AMP-binding protein [Lentzea sp. JNUCC 0626]|uniref:AMP-binding protein n=1 Tax=Lentzea sp. JNUCC 0626 TaxID=3367513 RepID=UPI0037497831